MEIWWISGRCSVKYYGDFEHIADFDNPIEENDALIEYSEEELELYNYVITAHADDPDRLTISFFKPDQWEMVISTANLLKVEVEEIVRGLGPDEVHQLVINSADIDPNDFPL